jgi:hypothetical protein
MMRLLVLCLALLAAAPLHAQDRKQRMIGCNEQAAAKGVQGAERSRFITECMKDKPQDRMAKCNVEAAGFKIRGEERKRFIDKCLKA